MCCWCDPPSPSVVRQKWLEWLDSLAVYIYIYIQMCVCGMDREKERERDYVFFRRGLDWWRRAGIDFHQSFHYIVECYFQWSDKRESLSLSERREIFPYGTPTHTHTHSDASSYSFLIRCVMKDSWRPLINRYFARPANTEVPLFFSHLPVIKLLLTHDDSYQNRQQQQRNTKKKHINSEIAFLY